MNLRIVDLETKSYASTPRTISRRTDSRIEEITGKLANSVNKNDASRPRTSEQVARDAKFQQSEIDRQRAKWEEERKAYEGQLARLRETMDTIVRQGSEVYAPPSI